MIFVLTARNSEKYWGKTMIGMHVLQGPFYSWIAYLFNWFTLFNPSSTIIPSSTPHLDNLWVRYCNSRQSIALDWRSSASQPQDWTIQPLRCFRDKFKYEKIKRQKKELGLINLSETAFDSSHLKLSIYALFHSVNLYRPDNMNDKKKTRFERSKSKAKLSHGHWI